MTQEKLFSTLLDGNLTPGERFIVEWQFRLLGDFRKALMHAIVRADEGNLALLMMGFPLEVGAYLEWRSGKMGQFLRSTIRKAMGQVDRL